MTKRNSLSFAHYQCVTVKQDIHNPTEAIEKPFENSNSLQGRKLRERKTFSDLVQSTVAPVLGKSRRINPEAMHLRQERHIE